jgi:hypothetical protein
MSTFSYHRIRLKCQMENQDALVNILTGKSPYFWRGAATQIEVGVFMGDSLLSIANLDSITVEFKDEADREGAPLATETVAAADMEVGLLDAEWALGTKAHAIAQFEHTQLAFSTTGAVNNEKIFWLVISAVTTDGKKLVIGGTQVVMKIHGATTTIETPPLGGANYYTQEESDARYLINTIKVINDPGVVIMQKSANDRWMRVFGVSDDGERYDTLFQINP